MPPTSADSARSQLLLTGVRDLVDLVRERSGTVGRPLVVGVSGFCGAGKSTLTRAVVAGCPGSVRMRGDDFLDPVRSHLRSTDWDGVERVRLVETVLDPFRRGEAGAFRRFDRAAMRLGPPEALPQASVLVVDLIGLFHPESLEALDLTIWCDADQETARRRGVRRDEVAGRDHGRLWDEVRVPNDRDFADRFHPAEAAHVRCAPPA
ncbi:MAG TPA: phosphoglycerate transporter [Cellulomonas sp.]